MLAQKVLGLGHMMAVDVVVGRYRCFLLRWQVSRRAAYDVFAFAHLRQRALLRPIVIPRAVASSSCCMIAINAR